jgi:hypothetical protein
MNNPVVKRRQQKLDRLFAQVAAFVGPAGKPDIEMQAQWARHLCVLTSGFIETSVRQIFEDYAKSKTYDARLFSYVSEQLARFQNPRMDAICQLCGTFSADWRAAIEAATAGELRESVNSIVSNRHLIAHGEDSGISYVQMKTYYERAVKMLELLEQHCV